MKLPTFPRLKCVARLFSLSRVQNTQISPSAEDKPQKHYGSCRKRRGAAAVEFAIVAPVFFILIFGMIEFGRMVMVQQILTNASREGARKAVLDGSTATDVNTTVRNNLGDASITINDSEIIVDPPNPSTAQYGSPVTVTVTVPFSRVSWLPAPFMLNFLPAGQTDVTLRATTVMRRETVQQ
jgi:Flp pilus assembly protein TadG